MEFAKSLPIRERVRGFKTKVFLKRYALRYLPEDIVCRRKRGLSVPIGRWLRGPLQEWASATLESGRLERIGIHTSAALDLFSEHCQRRADHARASGPCLSSANGWIGRLRKPIPAPAKVPSESSKGARFRPSPPIKTLYL